MEVSAEHTNDRIVPSVLPENLHEKLELRGNKQRFAKQVEVMEECDRAGPTKTSVIRTHSTEDEQSPISDNSDCTVVPAEKEAVLNDSSSKDGSPVDSSSRLDLQQEIEDKGSGTAAQVVSVKVRLVRSKAVYDDVSSSPPPDIHIYQDSTQTVPGNTTLMLSPNIAVRSTTRHKLGHDNSQGSSMSDGGTSPALSRDSSFDAAYTDSTGTNLEEFIIRTLNKNRNDCAMLLRLENDMINFIKDNKEEKHKFPQMSSYHRMLVHRVSAFFGLEHNVDDSGKCVVINRSTNTRLPEFKFRDHIWEETANEDQPKKLILRRHRDCTSLEETLESDRLSADERKCKSFEEREEEYLEARNRIFQNNHVLVYQEDAQSHVPTRPDKLCHDMNSSAKDEVYWLGNDVRPWSSIDSSGYSTDGSCRLRVSVTKASSFHGVTVLTRGDSNSSGTSRLSKTDSTSSGVSGLNSPVIIPPAIPCSSHNELLPPNSLDILKDQPTNAADEQGEPLAIWVASTIDQIPPGSFIINPQTGKPYTNPDGSMYKWFPPCHNADENSSATCFTSVSLPAHCTQEQLASSISALSINTPDTISAVPSNYSLSASQFCIQPQPLQVMCQPDIGAENRQDLYMSPTPAAAGSGSTTALQLITLPQMTVQSIESYPVTMQLQSSVLQQQTSIQQSQPYCIELGQLKADVNYKGNASPVFYAPVGIQMQVPAQAARYHMACSVAAPYQPVVYPEHLTETGTSAPSKLRYILYSTDSAVSQHQYAVSSMTAHNVLPPTTCAPASSNSCRNNDQLIFAPIGCDVQPRPLAYRHPTVVAGESRTVQQNLQMSFHQDLLRLRIPRLPEISPIVQQTPSASGFQQNVVTWPAQPMPSGYVEACGSSALQVCGLPPGLHHSQLEPYLADLVMVHGARRIDVVQNASNNESASGPINVANCTILAIFDNETVAQKAIASNAACGGKYQLQMVQHYHS